MARESNGSCLEGSEGNRVAEGQRVECPEGTAEALILMHGRLWPCGVRSVEYNKMTIVNACNFFSGANDIKERYKISTSLKLDDPCPRGLPPDGREQVYKTPLLSLTEYLFASLVIGASSGDLKRY